MCFSKAIKDICLSIILGGIFQKYHIIFARKKNCYRPLRLNHFDISLVEGSMSQEMKRISREFRGLTETDFYNVEHIVQLQCFGTDFQLVYPRLITQHSLIPAKTKSDKLELLSVQTDPPAQATRWLPNVRLCRRRILHELCEHVYCQTISGMNGRKHVRGQSGVKEREAFSAARHSYLPHLMKILIKKTKVRRH